MLSRDNLQTQKLCVEVVAQILNAAEISIKHFKFNEVVNSDNDISHKYTGVEGAKFDPKTSLAFAALEVSLCLLVRQVSFIF